MSTFVAVTLMLWHFVKPAVKPLIAPEPAVYTTKVEAEKSLNTPVYTSNFRKDEVTHENR